MYSSMLRFWAAVGMLRHEMEIMRQYKMEVIMLRYKMEVIMLQQTRLLTMPRLCIFDLMMGD